MDYYIHSIPGRLRVKSPIIKNNKKEAVELKKHLNSFYGIITTDINIITGSILVVYNIQFLHYGTIINILQQKGYFDPAKAKTNDEYIRIGILSITDIVGKSVLSIFLSRVLNNTPLSFLTIFF